MQILGHWHRLWPGVNAGSFQAGLTVPTAFPFDRATTDSSRSRIVRATEQAKANLAYLTHAANVLPELVDAVKNTQRNWQKNLTEPTAKLNQAIAKAETISRKETI